MFHTIGHSNRTWADFTALLVAHGIQLVADVRRLPGSARYPQFNEEALAAGLGELGIDFRRSPGLAGRRPRSKEVPDQVNAWWQNRSFHNYADHAMSQEFAAALAELRDWGTTRNTAVMCAEALWWRCHRRIIADHLVAAGEEVLHIVDIRHAVRAELSAGARVGPDSRLTYPAGH